jgi:acetoin utilization deacetylase AcuC-like enzyme
MTTGFFHDERCFWHSGGNYALTLPVGDLVQPLAAGGLPESPETKRRLKNLAEVSGLLATLKVQSAAPATWEDLARVHPETYLQAFKDLSDAGGGELGLRTPFGKGGFEIAALSAGLAKAALHAVATGQLENAYALSRPPGHHCLPDWPNGFCLMANIPVAIEAARAAGLLGRVAVVDWDVHHGNGTEAIYYERGDTLTISVHQERNYPLDTGDITDRGRGDGMGTNINIPLPPGAGHDTYMQVMHRIIRPALEAFQPDAIIVACGYDASAFDPLARMLASAQTFREMTAEIKDAAAQLCQGRLLMVHEGGYSEAYVPFCGHAVLEALSGSPITAPDPMANAVAARQPNPSMQAVYAQLVEEMAQELGL